MSWWKMICPVRLFTWVRRHHSSTFLNRVRTCASSKVNVLCHHDLEQIQLRKPHIFTGSQRQFLHMPSFYSLSHTLKTTPEIMQDLASCCNYTIRLIAAICNCSKL